MTTSYISSNEWDNLVVGRIGIGRTALLSVVADVDIYSKCLINSVVSRTLCPSRSGLLSHFSIHTSLSKPSCPPVQTRSHASQNPPARLEDRRTARVPPLPLREFQKRPKQQDARPLLAESLRRLVSSLETPFRPLSRFASKVRDLRRSPLHDSKI